MANKTKSAKNGSKQPDKFKQEKEETVEVKKLLKDERTHKIAGIGLLLLAFLLFIAFTSYLFTWQKDQSLVNDAGWNLLKTNDLKVDNLLGTLGAFLSHLFIYKGFGVASYLFCTTFFVFGINLFFGKKVFQVFRNIKYLIVGLPIVSVSAASIFKGNPFPWGGATGDMMRDWLYSTIGQVGTIAVLLVAILAYVIWRFNPSFKMPAKKSMPAATDDFVPTAEELSEKHAWDANEDESKKNSLKGNNTMLQTTQAENTTPLHNINLIEKEEDEKVEPVVVVQKEAVIAKEITPSDMPLEIKSTPEKNEEEPVVAEKQPTTKPYDPVLDLRDYKYPELDLLESHGIDKIVQDADELENNKNQIINTLKNYDIQIQKIYATVGPTVTLYEIIPAAGVRISRIKNLEDDIALSLAALGIRIIAPIPGKGTIGIEVPNAKKSMVSMKTLLSSEKFQKNNFSLPIAIGKKIDNENFIVDLASMPHLLMAGATGQGKSVGLNAILVSLLYKKHPSQLKFVLVDPKKVELSIYKTIENHFLAKLPGEEDAIITDTKKVVHTLNAMCIEMDNRYDLLKEAGCRNIKEYNEKFISRKLNPEKGHQYLPFIVLVVDEFADLIMTAGKEVEMPIARLAQLARAIGIHLIIATQRPSVNIITGTIKANFPARIAFKVSSKIDSRTILDTGGAEQLIGKGDMLISYNGNIVRLQCAFVDTPEVDKIVDFIAGQRGYPQPFLLPEYIDEKDMEGKDFDLGDKDPLFEDAARLIVASQVGSTSLLQRRMKLGYNRAGRLMDQLEAAGIVGANQGSKARDVLIKTEADLLQILSTF
ncbi:MAG: DNA translocase FtsK 4TM domain-containing protein [Ferruginibacter sp.]|nr:DNA translocase FtsK 4TM domain-containing protein [Ferruginibacter sp.]